MDSKHRKLNYVVPNLNLLVCSCSFFILLSNPYISWNAQRVHNRWPHLTTKINPPWTFPDSCPDSCFLVMHGLTTEIAICFERKTKEREGHERVADHGWSSPFSYVWSRNMSPWYYHWLEFASAIQKEECISLKIQCVSLCSSYWIVKFDHANHKNLPMEVNNHNLRMGTITTLDLSWV